MADEQKEKGKGHGAMLSQSVQDAVVKTIVDWFLGKLKTTREEKVAGKLPHYLFGEAMTKLKTKNRNAHKKINDFLAVYLTDRESQKQFVENAALVGGQNNVEQTVTFLEQLAELPDHDTRELVLTSMGYIGSRSVSMKERAINTLMAAGKTATNGVKADLDAAIATISGVTTGAEAEQKTSDALTAAKNRFAAMKTRL